MDLLSNLKWIIPLYGTFILFYSLAKYLLTKHKPYSQKLPPGPSPLPMFGNLLKILPYSTKPHKCFAMLAKIHGPIMTLQLGSITAIVISTSTLAKQVLLKNHQVSSTPYDLDAVRAHEHGAYSIGPLPASTPMWKILRKIYSNQLLNDKMLEAMQNHRHKMLEKLLYNFKCCALANVSIDVGQAVYDASFNMMYSMLFSLDLSSDDEKINEIKNLMNCIIKEIGRPNIVDCYPFLKVLDPQRIRHRLTSYCVKLFKLFDEILEERSKSREDQVKCSSSYNDLLDVILEVMEEQGDEIKREHIHHLLLDILGAGMDTTSKTIEWAMAELLRNPKAVQKLQVEIDRVVGKSNTIISESNVTELPYLRAIVTETLRLHPPAPLLLPRKVEEDINIDGLLLPKGAMLIVNAWAIGRDPLTWADPDSFSPERFLGSDLDVKSQVIKLYTFGAGKKICPGMPLALRISYLVLANLISHFDWKLENNIGEDLDMEMDDFYGITIKKAKPLRAFPLERV